MKTLVKLAAAAAFCLALTLPATHHALAYNPTLTVNQEGGADNVRITVQADPWSQITLYRRQSTQMWTVITNFGQTDGSGYFSQLMSLGSDGTNSVIEMYAMVNGQQSSTVQTYPYNNGGCTYNCGSPTGLNLSQSSITLSQGQNMTVTANNAYGSMYISGNTNSSVASASLSGNQINVYGNSNGSTTITVCANNNGCASLYVNVNNNGGYCTFGNCNNVGGITFSNNNPSLSVGQSMSITVSSPIYGASQSFYVSNNSNNSVVTASMNGSTLQLYGQNSGSSTIAVCQSGTSACSNLYVTVNGSGYCTFGNCGGNTLSLSQSSLTLSQGQTATVTSYSSSGNLYVSGNTNSGVASYTTSGNQITIYGVSNGSTTFTICASGYSCASLYVTVTGYGNNGSVTLSQNSMSLNVGQNLTTAIYGSGSGNYYVSNNSNSGVASASINGSTVNVYGNSAGSTNITVCQSGNNNCATLYVSVSGSGYYGGSLTLSQNSINLSTGQNLSVTVNGYSGSLYISNNSNSSVATASISGNTVYVYANNTGSTTISICQNYNSSACASLYVTVNGYNNNNNYGAPYFTSLNLPAAYVGQYYSQQLSVSGGQWPYTYTVSSGYLPNGMSLSSSGQLYGTPVSSGTYTVSIQVRDNYGRTAVNNFSLTISGSGSVLGSSVYNNGQLILENNTVYIVYKNTKTGFASRTVFQGLGYSFNNVISTGYSGLGDSGYIVRTSRAAHPWGSWVKQGSTIYFVHELGLIPVPDYNTFTSNGGSDNLVVPANTWDFQRPMLSTMTWNDGRMR